MRFEDSPELFGVGSGVSTTGYIECEWCGNVYEDPADIESVSSTDFAGKQVCDCCFEKIEREILYRMPDILKWYSKIVAKRKESVEQADNALKAVGA